MSLSTYLLNPPPNQAVPLQKTRTSGTRQNVAATARRPAPDWSPAPVWDSGVGGTRQRIQRPYSLFPARPCLCIRVSERDPNMHCGGAPVPPEPHLWSIGFPLVRVLLHREINTHDGLAPRRQAPLCKGLAIAVPLRNSRVPKSYATTSVSPPISGLNVGGITPNWGIAVSTGQRVVDFRYRSVIIHLVHDAENRHGTQCPRKVH